VSEPSTVIWFYTNGDKEVILTILNNKKEILFTQKVVAKKGLNKVSYDFSMSKTAAENWNNKDKNIKIKEAENKKNYLPISKYTVVIQNEIDKETTTFEISDTKKNN
jgi:Icc-related predicted phosphoesterase